MILKRIAAVALPVAVSQGFAQSLAGASKVKFTLVVAHLTPMNGHVATNVGPLVIRLPDDEDTKLGVSAAGGLEKRMADGDPLNFELRLGFVDAQDL